MKKNSKGFTLNELLLVIAIMGILLAMSFSAYQGNRGQFALQRSAHKLAQDIRRTSEMAMSAKEVGPAGLKIIPSGGYGIYLDLASQEIIIFADCDSNRQYNTSGEPCGIAPNAFPEKVEEIKLENNVEIQSIIPSSPLNITFQPPNPITYINGIINSGSASITLIYKPDPVKIKTIRIYTVGLVDVE